MKLNDLIKPTVAAFALSLAFAVSTARADSAVPKTYPLKKCVVSGEEIGGGEMKPFKVIHEGTDVWLCCKSCVKDFNKDPGKYVKQVKDAQAKKK